MTSRAKNRIFPIVAGTILTVTAVIGGVMASQHHAHVDGQQARLHQLEVKTDAARGATNAIQTDGSLADGARASRVAADTKVVDALANRALTWNNDASYRQARSSTMRIYGLAESSVFMKSFLPPAPVNRDSKGNVYPYIDAAGLNSSVGDTTVKLLGVNGTAYSYMALVDVQSESSDNLGTAVNVATIFVTIDDAGKVSNVSGYASTTQVRSSL
jgi:hypothetical protein